jgi:predicted transcriptional regulator
MRTAKQGAVALINSLPDDVSIEEIHYRLYVLEHIRAGLADIEAGREIPHEEVVAGFSKRFPE